MARQTIFGQIELLPEQPAAAHADRGHFCLELALKIRLSRRLDLQLFPVLANLIVQSGKQRRRAGAFQLEGFGFDLDLLPGDLGSAVSDIVFEVTQLRINFPISTATQGVELAPSDAVLLEKCVFVDLLTLRPGRYRDPLQP